MATYLPGVTDYIPAVQPWSPDYNFYQSALSTKQSQFNTGWDKMNSIYNSVLNAPMMREQNIAKRDNFFKNIEGELNKMASVDLSLPQNVDAAASVFKPFYEDDYIVKDIGFTKKYSDELELAESYRKCMDEKCKGKYWQGGVRALQYHAQDFINATDDQSLRIRNPEYTPYVNMMEKATAAAKEAGLSIKVDHLQGGYIVTTKNGPELQMPLMNFLMQRFGDDPEFQQFYNTKAYLLTKEDPELANKMYKEAMNNPRASQEEVKASAEKEFLVDTYENSRKVIGNAKEAEENRFMALVKKRSVIENTIRQSGMLPDSDEANEFQQLVQDQERQGKVVEQLSTYNDRATNTQAGLEESGLIGNEDQMRAVIANAMQVQDTYGAASILAYKDYERTMEADPFALENQRHQHSVQLAQMKQQWTMQNKAVDYYFKKSLNGLKDGTVQSLGNDYWFRGSTSVLDILNGGIRPGGSINKSGAADQLAMQLLTGTLDPYSNATMNGDVMQALIEQKNYSGALDLMMTGNRDAATKLVTGTAPDRSQGSITPGGGVVPDVINRFNNAGKGKMTEQLNILKGVAGVLDTDLDESHTKKIRENFNSLRAIMQGEVGMRNKEINAMSGQYNKTYLKTLMSKASDGGDPESDKAQLEFLDLGTHILNRFNTLKDKFGKDYLTNYKNYQRIAKNEGFEFPDLTEEEFNMLRKLPTHTKNGKNANADFYRQVYNSFGADKLVSLAGGNQRLYSFLNNSKGSWVKDPQSGRVIDKRSTGIIDDNTYEKYKAQIEEGIANSEIKDKVAKYERYENAETFQRHMGINSSLTSLQKYNMDKNTQFLKSKIYTSMEAKRHAIDNWNKSLSKAQAEILRDMTAGSNVSDAVLDVVKENIIKKEGDIWRLATDAEITSALAENIGTKIGPEHSGFENNLLGNVWSKSVGTLINELGKGGKVSTKAKLNLLSVSEYASKRGAEENGAWFTTSKPDYSRTSGDFVNAIAGYKFEEDQKKPVSQRKFSNIREAIVATIKENPYGGSDYFNDKYANIYGLSSKDVGENRKISILGLSNMQNEHKAKFDPAAQKFLRWLGKYEGALESGYEGKEWTVKPSSKYVKYFGGKIHPTIHKLSFQLHSADVDNGYVNSLEDHSQSIAQAHKEFLYSVSDQKSPFGSYFQGKGMGSWSAPTTMLTNITPTKKDQNYYDALAMFRNGVEAGKFESPTHEQALQSLFNDMKRGDLPKGKNPYFNIEIDPIHGDYNTAKYTLTFTDKGWEEYKGYNKQVSEKGKGTVTKNPLPKSFSWTVDNPTDPIVANSKPGMYDMILGGLDKGETWTDNSLRNEYGSIYFNKVDDGVIEAGFNMMLFNPNTGKEELRKIEGIQMPYYGTNWVVQHDAMLEKMMEIKQYSNITKQNYMLMNGATDPATINRWYAEQGVQR